MCDEQAVPVDGADAFFDALADEHRRSIVRRLARADGDTASEADLVDRIADEEGAAAGGTVGALYHVHLPKLAAADIVEHDARSGTVRYRGGELIEGCLEIADRREGE